MIEVSHLTKRYGNHLAVSDVSCTIEPGHIYGLLGPNGAGKSTTMNIMTGCLAATEGQVTIGGHDIFEDAEDAKKMLGYLPEHPPLYLDMTPDEYLSFVAKAKGVPKRERAAQLDRVSEMTQIEDVRYRLIKNLSKGFRQRVGIAQALLGRPEVIILDEPTVGLDPLQIIEIRDLIRDLGKAHTVVLSSHILSEVRAVCDHVMIISHGKLVASDTPDNLEKLSAGTATLALTVKANEKEAMQVLTPLAQGGTVAYSASDIAGCTNLELHAGDPDALAERLFYTFSEARRPILRMTTNRASLEEVFLELTGEKDALAEAEAAIDRDVAQANDTGAKEE